MLLSDKGSVSECQDAGGGRCARWDGRLGHQMSRVTGCSGAALALPLVNGLHPDIYGGWMYKMNVHKCTYNWFTKDRISLWKVV